MLLWFGGGIELKFAMQPKSVSIDGIWQLMVNHIMSNKNKNEAIHLGVS